MVSAIDHAANQVRGYGRVDLTAEACTITFRGLADATRPTTTVSTLARFEVEAGRLGLRRA